MCTQLVCIISRNEQEFRQAQLPGAENMVGDSKDFCGLFRWL